MSLSPSAAVPSKEALSKLDSQSAHVCRLLGSSLCTSIVIKACVCEEHIDFVMSFCDVIVVMSFCDVIVVMSFCDVTV